MNKPQIETFNHLRIFLSYLLELGETKIYYRLSNLIEIVTFDLISRKLEFSNSPSLLCELKTDLERITQSDWQIFFVKEPIGETYTNFLSDLDQEQEMAIKNTVVVNYLLKNLKNLHLDRIELDKRLH